MNLSSAALLLASKRVSCAWENNFPTLHPEHTKVQSLIDKAFEGIKDKVSGDEFCQLETATYGEARLQAEVFYLLGIQDAAVSHSPFILAF